MAGRERGRGGGADSQGADYAPSSPTSLLWPHLAGKILLSHVVPLLAGHSRIFPLSTLLSVFRDSLPPSSAWLGPFPGLPAMGRIHQYVMVQYMVSVPHVHKSLTYTVHTVMMNQLLPRQASLLCRDSDFSWVSVLVKHSAAYFIF